MEIQIQIPHSLHHGYTGATGAGLKSTECASGGKNIAA